MTLAWRRRQVAPAGTPHYFWKCTEGSGNFADTGVNSSNLSLVPSNLAAYAQAGLFAVSGAAQFTANTGYAATGTGQTIVPSSGLTMMVAVKFAAGAPPGFGVLAYLKNVATTGYIVLEQLGDQVRVILADPTLGQQVLDSTAGSALGAIPYTYAVTYAPAGTVEMFKNGSSIFSGSTTRTLPTLKQTILANIPGSPFCAGGLYGGLDVYEGVRSHGDITALSASILAM